MGDLDYDDNCLAYIGDEPEPFSGLAYSTQGNAFRDAEITYVNGLRHGPCREWYGPGRLALDEVYFDDALHGSARHWHKNGQLEEEGEYEYGVTLWEKSWDENGNLLKDYTMPEDSSDRKFLQGVRERRAQAARFAT
ncbi:hypothetical protein [Streptomyces sp. NPDC006510]|uniref:toxin-antitoxin system YwqK family antitoxin n=1 Tax=Streptomyces sp. NPDC006510 TaxID=3155600 RepID=UPI0033AF5155